MINQESSYFYYPTTTIILDDEKEFLDELSQSLESYNIGPIRTFVDPQQALSYFKVHDSSIYKNYQKYLETIDSIEIDNNDSDLMSKINFSNISALPYDEKRYDEVSVVIADYFMPQMNGIDFFKKIQHIPAKKILLTGAADYKLAVSAFNDRLIDRFIIKERIQDELVKSIGSANNRYFYDFSEALLHIFDKGIKNTTQYTSIVSTWHTKNKITEYYQCDANGSCFGFDNSGIIHWLLICPDKVMNDYINIAEYAEDGSFIAEELRLKQQLLFFFSEEAKLLPVQTWRNNIFPIKGELTIDHEKYFYSFVSNNTFGIDLTKIKILKMGN